MKSLVPLRPNLLLYVHKLVLPRPASYEASQTQSPVF